MTDLCPGCVQLLMLSSNPRGMRRVWDVLKFPTFSTAAGPTVPAVLKAVEMVENPNTSQSACGRVVVWAAPVATDSARNLPYFSGFLHCFHQDFSSQIRIPATEMVLFSQSQSQFIKGKRLHVKTSTIFQYSQLDSHIAATTS